MEKKIKNLAYNTNKLLNSRFFHLIIFLETRLNIIILRLGFCQSLHVNEYNYKCFVNNKSKK
jgi:ribosomal protein S4